MFDISAYILIEIAKVFPTIIAVIMIFNLIANLLWGGGKR